ncbi:MAG: hypothetical protein ACYSUX_12255 [Planctomycetota bacterium]
MKNRMFTVAVVLSVLFCRPPSWSIENPGIGNPVGPATVPPSTYGTGLVSNPSPIDTSGNLLITGNVRRGRHFRGNVPYQSATSLSSSLGSSSLSSFLRDTAGSEDLKRYSNKYGTQPYYSPTQTVTTMMPGRSEVFRPASTRTGTRAQQNTRSAGAGVSSPEFRQKEQPLFNQAASTAGSGLQRPTIQYGPLAQSRLMLESKFPTNISLNPRNKEQMMPAQIDTRRRGESSVTELFEEQLRDIRDRSQNSTNAQDWGNNIENLKPQFEMQKPEQNLDGDNRQATFTHQGISPLKQYASSVDSKSQSNLFLQNAANSSIPGRDFEIGRGQDVTGSIKALEKDRSDSSGKTGIGKDREQVEVLERIRRQLDDLTKALDATPQSRNAYKNVSTETTLGHQRYAPDSRQNFPRERINSGDSLNSYPTV